MGRKGGVRKGYRRFVADECERCGFNAEHQCQMDIHHRDGNHKNNELSNLGTLCANCHRLTHLAPHLLKPKRKLVRLRKPPETAL